MICIPFPAIVSIIFTSTSTIVSVSKEILFYKFPFYYLAIISISEISTVIRAFTKIFIGRKLRLLMVDGTKSINWSLGVSFCYFIPLTRFTMWGVNRNMLTWRLKIGQVRPMSCCIYLRKMVIQEFSWWISIIVILSVLTATPLVSRIILPTTSCWMYLSVMSFCTMRNMIKGRAFLSPGLRNKLFKWPGLNSMRSWKCVTTNI